MNERVPCSMGPFGLAPMKKAYSRLLDSLWADFVGFQLPPERANAMRRLRVVFVEKHSDTSLGQPFPVLVRSRSTSVGMPQRMNGRPAWIGIMFHGT